MSEAPGVTESMTMIRCVHDWQGLEPGDRGASVALGNFDGVHLGHRRVIAAAKAAAGGWARRWA